jgi:hypothetical protein
MSNNTNLDVANTILAQLGGAGRLRAMLGTKQFVGHKDALSFRFVGSKKRVFGIAQHRRWP